MLTIELPKDQEEPLAIAEVVPIRHPLPRLEAQQRLDQAKAHLDRAVKIVEEEAIPLVNFAIDILVEIQNEQAWQELGYRSMRQLIQAELQPLLNRSVPQIYRRLNAAKVRQQISHLGDSIDDIPNSQLEEVNKLPSEQWTEAWTEITATAPNGKVTSKHVKAVVNRRLSQQANESVTSLAPIDDRNRPLEDFVQPEEGSADTKFDHNSTPTPHSICHQIVIIRDSDRFTPQQRKYTGCWGVVSYVLESGVLIDVCGETVEYPSEDLEYITAPSAIFVEVCDRVMNLWRVPDLPAFVQDFLKKYYHRKLDFAQENLDTLKLIQNLLESLCLPGRSQEYYPIAMQSDFENSGVCNQISRIICPTE